MAKTQLANIGIALFLLVTLVFTMISQGPYAFAFVSELTDSNFARVISQNKLILVEFWQRGCIHCERMVYPFEQFSTSYGNMMTFARLNIQDYPGISQDYQIESTPTFVLFVNGNPIGRLVGENVQELRSLLVKVSDVLNWRLDVAVNNIPNDVERVVVTVKSPFKEQTSKVIGKPSFSDRVSTVFSIPADKIPDGYNYKVCARASGAGMDWCRTYNYEGGSHYRAMLTLPNLSPPSTSGSGRLGSGSSTGCPTFSPTSLIDHFDTDPGESTLQQCSVPDIEHDPLNQ